MPATLTFVFLILAQLQNNKTPTQYVFVLVVDVSTAATGPFTLPTLYITLKSHVGSDLVHMVFCYL